MSPFQNLNIPWSKKNKNKKTLATPKGTYIKIYSSSLLYHSARMNILRILKGEARLGISKQHEAEI